MPAYGAVSAVHLSCGPALLCARSRRGICCALELSRAAQEADCGNPRVSSGNYHLPFLKACGGGEAAAFPRSGWRGSTLCLGTKQAQDWSHSVVEGNLFSSAWWSISELDITFQVIVIPTSRNFDRDQFPTLLFKFSRYR